MLIHLYYTVISIQVIQRDALKVVVSRSCKCCRTAIITLPIIIKSSPWSRREEYLHTYLPIIMNNVEIFAKHLTSLILLTSVFTIKKRFFNIHSKSHTHKHHTQAFAMLNCELKISQASGAPIAWVQQKRMQCKPFLRGADFKEKKATSFTHFG